MTARKPSLPSKMRLTRNWTVARKKSVKLAAKVFGDAVDQIKDFFQKTAVWVPEILSR